MQGRFANRPYGIKQGKVFISGEWENEIKQISTNTERENQGTIINETIQ